MYKNRDHFYYKILPKRIKSKDASILVCGGGHKDKEVFLANGYKNVTISNIDPRVSENDFLPYQYKHEDFNKLSFKESSYDYVVIRDAIHHSDKPHQTLLELYKVAKIGLLGFESRDSLIIRLLTKMKLSDDYEHIAVFYNDCKYGGVNNTSIPNYVYRWTERELMKTIKSYSPEYMHEFKFDYGSAYPATPSFKKNNLPKLVLLSVAKPFYIIFSKIFYKQQNQFSFFILKPQNDKNLFPWIERDHETKDLTFNKTWGENIYKKQK